MGSKESKLYDFTRLPTFRSDGCFKEWRKAVANWVATKMNARDNDSDDKLKTQCKLRGRTIYAQALSSFQLSLIEEEVRKGILFLSSSTNPVPTGLAIVQILL